MENTTATSATAPTTTTSTSTPANTNPAFNTTLPTSTPQTQLPATTQAQTLVPTSGPQSQTLSFREKLDAGEQHWIWKISLRGLLLLLSVIGIGCLGWAVASASSANYSAFLDDQYWLWGTLVTFAVSIVWTLLCILVLLLRRPNRPVHPGVAVGMDLILWLAYIATTLLAVAACISLISFGSDGFINKYSSDGYYTQYPNGTWVYNATEYAQYYNQARSCNSSSSSSSRYYSYSLPSFDTCEEQDAFVNSLWNATKHRAGVVLTGTVCQGLVFLLHFMLFVWACVDVHRRNRSKPSADAEKLAADIIRRMVRDGAIVQPPGHVQQMQGRYQQLPNQGPQQYQQQPWYNGQAAQNRGQGYTVHQGPPPPIQQHPAMSGALPAVVVTGAPSLPQITEHYAPSGNEKGRGLGGPGPGSEAPVSPIVEHYGGNEKGTGGPSHAA